VKLDSTALNLLRQKKVRVRTFEIIYELAQDVRETMERILDIEIIKKNLGEVEILATFSKRKNRQTIGGKIITGLIEKSKICEILRDQEIIGKGKIINLQQNRKDTDKVKKGNEIGMLFESDVKIEEGDFIQMYEEEKKKGEL
jgi:translation initiation factor IF-2